MSGSGIGLTCRRSRAFDLQDKVLIFPFLISDTCLCTSEREGEAYETCIVVPRSPPPSIAFVTFITNGSRISISPTPCSLQHVVASRKVLDLQSQMVGSNLVQNIDYSEGLSRFSSVPLEKRRDSTSIRS